MRKNIVRTFDFVASRIIRIDEENKKFPRQNTQSWFWAVSTI